MGSHAGAGAGAAACTRKYNPNTSQVWRGNMTRREGQKRNGATGTYIHTYIPCRKRNTTRLPQELQQDYRGRPSWTGQTRLLERRGSAGVHLCAADPRPLVVAARLLGERHTERHGQSGEGMGLCGTLRFRKVRGFSLLPRLGTLNYSTVQRRARGFVIVQRVASYSQKDVPTLHRIDGALTSQTQTYIHT